MSNSKKFKDWSSQDYKHAARVFFFCGLVMIGAGWFGEVYPNNWRVAFFLILSCLGSGGLGYLLGRSMK